MAERFARRLLRRVETGEPFGPVALAQRVRHFFLGIDLAREPRALALVEAIPLDLRQVNPNPQDHGRIIGG